MNSGKKPYKKPELKKLQIPDAWGQEPAGFCGHGLGIGWPPAHCSMGFYPDLPGSCFGGSSDDHGGGACKTGQIKGL